MAGTLQRGEGPLAPEEAKLLDDISRQLGPDLVPIISEAAVSTFIRRRSLRWGYVDLYHSQLLFSRESAPSLAIAFLRIGGDMVFDRERHGDGVGYHYHYVNASRQRTSVAFTFSRDPTSAHCPVAWYRHAERGKAKANPDRWNWATREAVNISCKGHDPHLHGEFVRPPKKSALLISPTECRKAHQGE